VHYYAVGQDVLHLLLSVLGKSNERRFEKYHRILNRGRWSCVDSAKILLGLLLILLPTSTPVLVAVDETLERRKGPKIKAKGYYCDAVRSTEQKMVKCFGLKWIGMSLIVTLPWNKRPWALPFLTILAPSKKTRGRQHRTVFDGCCIMVRLVSRWLKKSWVLIGDGAYASIRLSHQCNKMGATLISRLRRDAVLYEKPESVPARPKGTQTSERKRIYFFKELLEDTTQTGWESEITWYGEEKKSVHYLTDINLCYVSGQKPLLIRWVLVVDKDNPANMKRFLARMSPLKLNKS
jgi:hypothetical protein